MKRCLIGLVSLVLILSLVGVVSANPGNIGSYYDLDLPDGQNWIIYVHDAEGNVYGSVTKDTATVVPSAYFYPDDSPEDAGYPVIATVPPEQEFYMTIVFRGTEASDHSYLRVPEVFDPLDTNPWNDLMFFEPYPYPWGTDSILEVTYPVDPATGENVDDGLNNPGGYYKWEKPTIFVFSEEGYWHFSIQTKYTEDSTRYAFNIHILSPVIEVNIDIKIDHAEIDFGSPAPGKVSLKGTLQLDLENGNGVNILEDVTVTVGTFSATIDGGSMVEKGKEGEKWEYKRPEDGAGSIEKMTIKWKTGNDGSEWKIGKFDMSMNKADLSELTNPVTISIQIGDDFGEETILMRVRWDYKAK